METARENPTDGYRMVWALVRRKLGIQVNRKRVLRVMREHKLIQRRTRQPRRRRYHHRPHSTLDYRTPKEVRQIWEDARGAEVLRKEAA